MELYADSQLGHWAVILPGELFGHSKDHRFEIPTTQHQLESVVWAIDSGLVIDGKIVVWFSSNPLRRSGLPLTFHYSFSHPQHEQQEIWGQLPACIEPRLQTAGREEVRIAQTCHKFDVDSLALFESMGEEIFESSMGPNIGNPRSPHKVELHYR